MPFEFEHLEGWLIKKHSTERKINFGRSTESRRWFKVTEVNGADATELILGYYASQKVKEAKGFIYLQDVEEIESVEPLGFVLHTHARDLSISCFTKPELRMWLEGLVKLCPKAKIDNVTEKINIPANRVKGDDKPLESDSKPSVGRNDETKCADEGKSNEECDDIDNKLKMPERSSSPERTELRSMKYADGDGNNEDVNNQDKMSASKGSARSNEAKRSSDVERGPAEIREKSSRFSSSRDREDHRINGFHPGAGSGATSRLHAHINHEAVGEPVLRPPAKDMRSSKEIIPTASAPSSSLVTRTTTEATSSTRTSKTEWINGNEVKLRDSMRDTTRGEDSHTAEDYADGPDIDELGTFEMATTSEPERQESIDDNRSQTSKENKRLSENYNGEMKGEGFSALHNHKEAQKTLRKASDGLYGDSQRKSKSNSIDDLLTSRLPQRDTDYKGYDDDEEEEHLDLALEKKRLADKKAKSDAKEAKDSKEVTPLELGSAYRVPSGSSRGSSLSGTPRSRSNSILEQHLIERESRVSIPQPPSEEKPPYAQKINVSGTSPDEAKRGSDSKLVDNKARCKTISQPSTAPDIRMSVEQLAKYGIGQGVAADENWLEEDFDS